MKYNIFHKEKKNIYNHYKEIKNKLDKHEISYDIIEGEVKKIN